MRRDWRPNRPFHCHADLNYENTFNKGVTGVGFNITSIASQKATVYAAQYTTTGDPPSGNTPNITTSPTRPTNSTTQSTTQSTTTGSSTLSPPSSHSLSAGGKAGIAVGVIAGVGAIALLGFMVWRNNRKVDHYAKPQGVEISSAYQDRSPHELGAYTPVSNYAMHSENRMSAYEGNAQPQQPAELEPLQAPQELPATTHR